ncbi:MAG: hypothetical protein VR67_02910 [Peptococcaceae bacterium BRH_c8a]|nr:MAG: hypothetical protein VR67_02910 [Peptococcaceae bacterium BRH_c8a]
MLRVTGIKLSLDEDIALLKGRLAKKLGVGESEILSHRIVRRSVDARKKQMIYFVYTVDVELRDGEDRVLTRVGGPEVTIAPPAEDLNLRPGTKMLRHRPVVVGTGPAGLFAGLLLAQYGYRPLLLERGADVDARTEKVQLFWQTGRLDPERNVQFGEGGAGTFSDGKLTTLIRDPRCRLVIEEMFQAGAPEEITYSHKPHVGTDVLRTVVKNIRRKIEDLGAEVWFNHRLTDINVTDGRLNGIVVNDHIKLETDVLVLAIGHSARDTFAMLHHRGVPMNQKPFSVGLRVEHPQELINRAQYKHFAGHPRLGPAEYKLAYHSPGGRSAYTFCMCPGGTVVAATSEEGGVVVNGMSYQARDGVNANSALLVGVKPGDYGSDHPLAGVEFQRRWEQEAFALGGGNYAAPVQLVGDFLAGRPSTGPGSVIPTYTGQVVYTTLDSCLPDYVINTLREAFVQFNHKLKGFAMPEAVLTGVETRSSSPVRILRGEDCQSDVTGLFPAGEGAGYAGGIMSSAADGLRAAEQIIRGSGLN